MRRVKGQWTREERGGKRGLRGWRRVYEVNKRRTKERRGDRGCRRVRKTEWGRCKRRKEGEQSGGKRSSVWIKEREKRKKLR